MDDANAFFPDPIGPTGQVRPIKAIDAESFAEEFIGAATAAESVSEDAEDEVVDDEVGGPFIVLDTNGSLPSSAEEREPEHDGTEPVQQVQLTRGARWAARGG